MSSNRFLRHFPKRHWNLTAIWLSFLVAGNLASAFAQNIYVSQNGNGSTNGVDAGDAYPVSWLDTTANWGTSDGQVGPGVTVHLCGTITNIIYFQGNGVSNNPVTILFEPNAKMSSPCWAGTHCAFNGNDSHDIIVDGGVNGLIECTSNGVALPFQVNANGFVLANPYRFTIQNLLFQNLAVMTNQIYSSTLAGAGVSYYDGDHSGSSNNIVTNCVFHDVQTGVNIGYGTNWFNFSMVNCTAYNVNWGGNAGDSQTTSSLLNGLVISGNHFYNWRSWDEPNDYNHHNGFYTWAESGGLVTNITYSGNTVGPGYGYHNSAGLFVSGNAANVLICNNILNGTDGTSPGDGFIFVWIRGNTVPSNVQALNNTVVGGGTGIGIEFYGGPGGIINYASSNNLIQSVSTAIAVFYRNTCTFKSDYNLIYNVPLATALCDADASSSQFYAPAAWQGLGLDPHLFQSFPNLASNFRPQGSSPVYGVGVNLSQFFTNDFVGTFRQPTNWDIGAYQHAGIIPPYQLHLISPIVATTNNVNGLVAWWPLDDLSGTDASGNGNTMNFASGASAVPGAVSNAVSLDGVSQFGATSAPSATTVPLTMTAWFRTLAQNCCICGMFNNTASSGGTMNGYFLGLGSGTVSAVTASSDNYAGAGSQATFNDGNVHFAAGVFTAGQQIIYVDGVPLATNSTAQAPTGLNVLSIGAIDRLNVVNDFFPGALDDVRVYNRALSAAEIANLYQWPMGGRSVH